MKENKVKSNMPITLDELSEHLVSMNGGKSPGNNGVTVEFYKHFWEDIKNVYFESIAYSISVGFLSVPQKQAIIKLLEKRDKDKRYVGNWRPISLLNVDKKYFPRQSFSFYSYSSHNYIL